MYYLTGLCLCLEGMRLMLSCSKYLVVCYEQIAGGLMKCSLMSDRASVDACRVLLKRLCMIHKSVTVSRY